jgi:hypothetical protein
MCISVDKTPLLTNVRTGLIDPDTPKSVYTKKSHQGQTLKLVVWSSNLDLRTKLTKSVLRRVQQRRKNVLSG